MTFSRDPRILAWVFFVATILGLGQFVYFGLDEVVRGREFMFGKPFVEEMTGAYGSALLFLILLAVVQRYPVRLTNWRVRVPFYTLGMLLFSAAHTTLNWATRGVLFPLVGLGDYDYGAMPLRYAMEFPNDVISFLVIVLGLHAWIRIRTARQRELWSARLEAELARAELRGLQMQLQPHFLFNALNTISEYIYESPEAADNMIGQLSEFLRHALRSMERHQITLQEEIEGLDIYIRLLRARFGDAIWVDVDVEDDAAGGCVPSLLLQPLVENAIQHGLQQEGGTIRIRGRRRNGQLKVEVTDDGRGCPNESELLKRGRGLSITGERLRVLYGEGARLEPRNRSGGGFSVNIELPYRETCAY